MKKTHGIWLIEPKFLSVHLLSLAITLGFRNVVINPFVNIDDAFTLY